jgi:hypothetical protein
MHKVFIFSGFVLFLGGCSVPFKHQAQGALQVTTNQPVVVYLSDASLGEAPIFNDKIKPGSYTLKLEPTDKTVKFWQTKVSVSSNTLTVVDYQANGTASSNYVLQLIPTTDQQPHLSVTTLPTNAVIKVDDQDKGFSPLAVTNVSAGDHTIAISAPSFQDKSINVKTVAGYNLVVQTELARRNTPPSPITSPETSTSGQIKPDSPATTAAIPTIHPSPTPNANPYKTITGIVSGYATTSDLKKPYVKILTAAIGVDWLRVRKDPSGITDNEVAKVKVGTYFPFLDVSKDHEWFKIQFGSDKTTNVGWMAAQYGELNQASPTQ